MKQIRKTDRAKEIYVQRKEMIERFFPFNRKNKAQSQKGQAVRFHGTPLRKSAKTTDALWLTREHGYCRIMLD